MKNFEIILDTLADALVEKDKEIADAKSEMSWTNMYTRNLANQVDELKRELEELKKEKMSEMAATIDGQQIKNPTTLYTKMGLESIARAVE